MSLFTGEVEAPPSRDALAGDPGDRVRELASSLPAEVRLGTSSWSFPGWAGLVYDRQASERTLARDGLAAYARHPLFGTVGVDRTYYRPMTAEALAEYASSVPDGFRFVVKAHQDVTLRRLRSGSGPHATWEPNGRFLDAAYASDAVVAPFVEGLGRRGGAIVFQLSPERVSANEAARFPDQIAAFLEALPKGPGYAVEVRSRGLFTDSYLDALAANAAAHCYTVYPSMPSLGEQTAKALPPQQPFVLCRWMLHAGQRYEDARRRYAPFDRLVDEDTDSRTAIARAAVDAAAARVPVYVIANNKAEGSAPLSLERLAAEVHRVATGC